MPVQLRGPKRGKRQGSDCHAPNSLFFLFFSMTGSGAQKDNQGNCDTGNCRDLGKGIFCPEWQCPVAFWRCHRGIIHRRPAKWYLFWAFEWIASTSFEVCLSCSNNIFLSSHRNVISELLMKPGQISSWKCHTGAFAYSKQVYWFHRAIHIILGK